MNSSCCLWAERNSERNSKSRMIRSRIACFIVLSLCCFLWEEMNINNSKSRMMITSYVVTCHDLIVVQRMNKNNSKSRMMITSYVMTCHDLIVVQRMRSTIYKLQVPVTISLDVHFKMETNERLHLTMPRQHAMETKRKRATIEFSKTCNDWIFGARSWNETHRCRSRTTTNVQRMSKVEVKSQKER